MNESNKKNSSIILFKKSTLFGFAVYQFIIGISQMIIVLNTVTHTSNVHEKDNNDLYYKYSYYVLRKVCIFFIPVTYMNLVILMLLIFDINRHETFILPFTHNFMIYSPIKLILQLMIGFFISYIDEVIQDFIYTYFPQVSILFGLLSIDTFLTLLVFLYYLIKIINNDFVKQHINDRVIT